MMVIEILQDVRDCHMLLHVHNQPRSLTSGDRHTGKYEAIHNSMKTENWLQ